VKDKVLGYRMDIQKEKDIAAIIAQARQQMARELTEDEDGQIGMGLVCDDCKVTHCRTDCPIRKAGGV
jgi:hypothetical protein